MLPIAPVQKDSARAAPGSRASKWGTDARPDQPRPRTPIFPQEEVAAGVSYQVTPRFRFGGSVTVKGDSLAQSLSSPTQTFSNAEDGSEASVRIESAFSF